MAVLDCVGEYTRLRGRYEQDGNSGEFIAGLHNIAAVLSPDDCTRAFLEGRAYFEEKAFDAAFERFEFVLAASVKQQVPREVVLWSLYNKAILMELWGKSDEACRLYEELVDSFEGEEGSEFRHRVNLARLNMARLWMEESEYRSAIQVCSEVRRATMDSDDAATRELSWRALSAQLQSLAEWGELRAAEECCDSELERLAHEPDRAYEAITLRLCRAWFAYARGENEEAIRRYEAIGADFSCSCTHEHPSISQLVAMAWANAANCLIRQESPVKSIMDCDLAFSLMDTVLDPDKVDFPTVWGIAYTKFLALQELAKKDGEVATLCEETSLLLRSAADPLDDVMGQQLARARLARDQHDMGLMLRCYDTIGLACTHAGRALRPASRRLLGYVLLARAGMHAASGRFREAADGLDDLIDFLRANRTDHDWAPLRNALDLKAMCLELLGEREEARIVYADLLLEWERDEATVENRQTVAWWLAKYRRETSRIKLEIPTTRERSEQRRRKNSPG